MRKRVAVITGGAKGIGAATVRLFSARGYLVAINYRRSGAVAERLAEEIISGGGQAVTVCADLSEMRGAEKLHSAVIDAFGGADVLVNNAGSCEYGLLSDFSEEDIRRSVGDDLLSAIFATKAFYDDFAFSGKGCIVNVSSVWGLRGACMESVYSAAKAGVIAFTRSMAKELAPSGVRVNAVAPGVIMTDMLSRFTPKELDAICSEIPLGRAGTPDDVARVIYFLASDFSSYITGQTFEVGGGYTGA